MWRSVRTRALPSALALLLAACADKPAPEPAESADAAKAGEARSLDDLRALPYLDFSPKKAGQEERDGVVALDSARAHPGYSLYTVRPFCRADLVDLRGRVVNSWSSSPCGRWAQAELLPDGTLLVVGREARAGRVLLRFAWNGDLLWRQRLPVHHDAERTPSGQLLALGLATRKVEFAGATRSIRDDVLLRLDDRGEIVDQRSLFDLFAAGPAPNPLEWVRVRERGASDVFHANSVEWMARAELFGTSPLYGASHVLVSIRHQDLVAIVDWESQGLIWSWGKGELGGPHDATLLADGNVLVFDNGLGRTWSRVVEVDPRTDRIVWQYKADPPEAFFTAALGGAQRLANGNTLIANSHAGEAFEVTREGEIVWRFLTPHKNDRGQRAAIVRMKRYDAALVEPLVAAARAARK